TQERDKGATAASAPRSAPFAPRVTCEYAFVKRSYLTATLATCSPSAAAPSSSFRRPQSGSIPTKSASCSYHALSRKARASAAQYGFPDRSEERRVGKECSSGWRAQPEKQQKTRGVRETRRRTTGECA